MTRFIPSEEIDSQRVRQWDFGSVRRSGHQGFSAMPEMTLNAALMAPVADEVLDDAASEELPQPVEQVDTVVVEEPTPALPTFSEEEVAQRVNEAAQQAREQGYQQGVDQGMQKAAQEWQARMSDYQNNLGRETALRLNEVLHAAQNAVQGFSQQVAPDLLQLATDVARQVVRQELRCNPQALQPVVAEALDMLGAETKPALVRLNPEDFKHLEVHLRTALPNPKVEWLADPSVAQGGCVVESQGAQVDGSLERRWQRAVAALGLVSTWYEGANHGN